MKPVPENPAVETLPMPRSLLFIDGTNLDHRLVESFGRMDLDYVKFFREISDQTRLQHVHYCTAPYIQTVDAGMYAGQMSTLNFLNTLRFVSIHKGRHHPRNIRCRRSTCSYSYTSYEEKRTDVHVASRIIHAACRKSAEWLILVANDTDYEPALRLAKDEGAKIAFAYVVSPKIQKALVRYDLDSLRKLADKIIEIDEAWVSVCWRPIKPRK